MLLVVCLDPKVVDLPNVRGGQKNHSVPFRFMAEKALPLLELGQENKRDKVRINLRDILSKRLDVTAPRFSLLGERFPSH